MDAIFLNCVAFASTKSSVTSHVQEMELSEERRRDGPPGTRVRGLNSTQYRLLSYTGPWTYWRLAALTLFSKALSIETVRSECTRALTLEICFFVCHRHTCVLHVLVESYRKRGRHCLCALNSKKFAAL